MNKEVVSGHCVLVLDLPDDCEPENIGFESFQKVSFINSPPNSAIVFFSTPQDVENALRNQAEYEVTPYDLNVNALVFGNISSDVERFKGFLKRKYKLQDEKVIVAVKTSSTDLLVKFSDETVARDIIESKPIYSGKPLQMNYPLAQGNFAETCSTNQSCSFLLKNLPENTQERIVRKSIKDNLSVKLEGLSNVPGTGWVLTLSDQEDVAEMLKWTDPVIAKRKIKFEHLQAQPVMHVEEPLCPYSIVITNCKKITKAMASIIENAMDNEIVNTEQNKGKSKWKISFRDPVNAENFATFQEDMQKGPIEDANMVGVHRRKQSLNMFSLVTKQISGNYLRLYFRSPENGGNSDVLTSLEKFGNKWLIKVFAGDEECLEELLGHHHDLDGVTFKLAIFDEEFNSFQKETVPRDEHRQEPPQQRPRIHNEQGEERSSPRYQQDEAQSSPRYQQDEEHYPQQHRQGVPGERTIPNDIKFIMKDAHKKEFLVYYLQERTMDAKVISTNDGVTVCCTLDDLEDIDSLKQWRPKMTALIEEVKNDISRREINIKKQLMEQLKDQLSMESSDEYKMKFDDENNKIIFVGRKKLVDQEYDKFSIIYHNLLPKKITESPPVKKPLHCNNLKGELLLKLKHCTNDYVKVTYEQSRKQLILEGPKEEVSEYKSDLQRIVDEFRVDKVELDSLFLTLLKQDSVKEHLAKMFEDKQWSYVVSEKFITVCAENEESFDAIRFKLTGSIFVYECKVLEKWILDKVTEFRGYFDSLVKEFNGMLTYSISEKNKELQWASIEHCASEVDERLIAWLNKNKIHEEEIFATQGEISLLKKWSQNDENLRSCEFKKDRIILSGLEKQFIENKIKLLEAKGKIIKKEKVIEKYGLPSVLRGKKREIENCADGEMATIVDQADDGNEVYSDSSRSPNQFGDGKDFQSENFQSNSVTITVTNQDITSLRNVDAATNCANTKLRHAGGIAEILSKKGGPTIQDSSDQFVSENGELSVGSAVALTAGRLPFKFMIHSVGPRFNEYTDAKKAKVKLYDCVWEILVKAEECGISSIAIPGISCGKFGFPSQLATSCIIEAVQDYIQEKNQSIRHIYLIDKNDCVHTDFLNGARNRFTTSAFGCKKSGNSQATKASYNMPRAHLPNKQNPNNIAVLVKGDLASQKTDIIVNSTHPKLQLNNGAASKSILAAAGAELQKECDQLIANRSGNEIHAPEFIISGGHNLNCKKIYHSSFLNWTGNKEKEYLEKFIVNILQDADGRAMESISIPAIGTGALQYPADKVAEIMHAAINRTMPTLKNLKNVFIVVYDRDFNTIKAFEQCDGNNPAATSASQSTRGFPSRHVVSSKDVASKQQTQGSIYKLSFEDKRYIELLKGDITDETTDAIVNSTADPISLDKGAVAQAIGSKGGQAVVNEVKNAAMKNGIAVTGSGQMACGHIIHIDAHFKSTWKEKMNAILECAEQHKWQKISVPAIGTGMLTQNSTDIAKDLIEEIVSFLETKAKHLEVVRVVIFQDSVFTVFQSTLEKKKQAPGVFGKWMMGKKSRGITVVEGARKFQDEAGINLNVPEGNEFDKLKMAERLVLVIRAFDEQTCRKIQQRIDDFKNDLITNKVVRVAHELLGKIDEKQKKELEEKLSSQFLVDAKFRGRGEPNLELRGLHDSVYEANTSLHLCFQEIEKRNLEEEGLVDKGELLTKLGIEWMYKEGESWINYHARLNGLIEADYQNKESTYSWEEDNGIKRTINFGTMKESASDGVVIDIQRKEKAGNLDSFWDIISIQS